MAKEFTQTWAKWSLRIERSNTQQTPKWAPAEDWQEATPWTWESADESTKPWEGWGPGGVWIQLRIRSGGGSSDPIWVEFSLFAWEQEAKPQSSAELSLCTTQGQFLHDVPGAKGEIVERQEGAFQQGAVSAGKVSSLFMFFIWPTFRNPFFALDALKDLMWFLQEPKWIKNKYPLHWLTQKSLYSKVYKPFLSAQRLEYQINKLYLRETQSRF